MKKFFTLTAIIFLTSFTISAQNWFNDFEKIREIKTLEVSKNEVRQIFSSYKTEPVETSEHYDIFYTNDAEIEFSYSEGNCDESYLFNFEAPEWRVVFINLTLNNPIKIQDFKFDLSGFRKERTFSDNKEFYSFHNKNLGIFLNVRKDTIESIHFMPPINKYNKMCNQDEAKILVKSKTIFLTKLKYRKSVISCPVANVKKLKLNDEIIKANCNANKSIIKVFTQASDPDNDLLDYSYTVSIGKIIGKGERVLWDLTGVKAGVYTITAAVDDGCGFCGLTKTKTITVKENKNCS